MLDIGSTQEICDDPPTNCEFGYLKSIQDNKCVYSCALNPCLVNLTDLYSVFKLKLELLFLFKESELFSWIIMCCAIKKWGSFSYLCSI